MIGFAHRGAPAAGMRENTLAAFTNALEKGLRALESDVWLTADGVPVLVHDGVLRFGLRRRPISSLAAAELPSWLPSLADLYSRTGGDFELSLDVKDAAAAGPVMEVARRNGVDGRLWLCGSAPQVSGWRPNAGPAHLVVSTSLRAAQPTDAERVAEAADAGAAALNLRAPEWSAQRVRLCHDRGLLAFAWDVQKEATLEAVRGHGCDGIFSDHVTLLAAL